MKLLFVCTGNICRSPTAEGVFRELLKSHGLADTVGVDSAGTSGWHEGESPDLRAQKASAARGVDLGGLRARPVRRDDFDAFDLIVAMDRGHLRALERVRPRRAHAELALFLAHVPDLDGDDDVPDPYYGEAQDFELVLDIIEEGCRYLLEAIRPRLAAP